MKSIACKTQKQEEAYKHLESPFQMAKNKNKNKK
jgi:hypothetical protein